MPVVEPLSPASERSSPAPQPARTRAQPSTPLVSPSNLFWVVIPVSSWCALLGGPDLVDPVWWIRSGGTVLARRTVPARGTGLARGQPLLAGRLPRTAQAPDKPAGGEAHGQHHRHPVARGG